MHLQICAWRPLPAGAEQIPPDGKPNYKDQLAREYLVKWTGRGFRHVRTAHHKGLLLRQAPRSLGSLTPGCSRCRPRSSDSF